MINQLLYYRAISYFNKAIHIFENTAEHYNHYYKLMFPVTQDCYKTYAKKLCRHKSGSPEVYIGMLLYNNLPN